MNKSIKRGDFYEGCDYHSRLCLNNNGESLMGISLINGTVGYCSIRYCKPKKIAKETAMRIATNGPISEKKKEYLKKFYAGEWGAGREIWWKEQ